MLNLGQVAKFWHQVEGNSYAADDATLEMFEGLTIEQLNDALFRFDSAGRSVGPQHSWTCLTIETHHRDCPRCRDLGATSC